MLLNHDETRELGSTGQGNLELHEDNIGLHAKATIYDKEVIDDARNNRLVGWSFGFYDRDVERSMHEGTVYRIVKDLDLREVSILNNKKTPAYDGTLIMARADDNGEMLLRGEDFIDEVIVREEDIQEDVKQEEVVEEPEVKEQPKQQEVVENINTIDYSKYETMIKEMKEE